MKTPLPRAALVLTVLLALPVALAGRTRPSAGSLDTDRATALLESDLPDVSADLLAPFRLTLGRAPEAQTSVPRNAQRQTLIAGPARYVRIGLGATTDAKEGVLPAPKGLDVLDADLYFADGRALTEVSMLVAATRGRDAGIEVLVGALGPPEFETVLPGNDDIALGWRASDGFVLATFTDLPVFRVNAFSNQPEDLMAGASMVLFEGLAHYAARLEDGESRDALDRQLLELMDWVEMARGALRPRR